MAYRSVAKQWLCKQRPFLWNARKNIMTGLYNPFLCYVLVNTPTTIGVMLEAVFSIRSVWDGYKEEFSWESSVAFRSSKWAVSRELGSARENEKMALWVQVWIVNQGATAWPRKLKNLHCVKSVAGKRLVESVIDGGHQSVCVSDL
jgi:hypothetical protein